MVNAPPAFHNVQSLGPKVSLPQWIDTHRPKDLIHMSNGSAGRALNYRQTHTHSRPILLPPPVAREVKML